MTTRRGFLASLGAFAASAVLDPERLLWIRGAKTISIPARGNTFISPEAYVKMALATLRDNILLVRTMNRAYNEEFNPPIRAFYPPIGQTINIRKPLHGFRA